MPISDPPSYRLRLLKRWVLVMHTHRHRTSRLVEQQGHRSIAYCDGVYACAADSENQVY